MVKNTFKFKFVLESKDNAENFLQIQFSTQMQNYIAICKKSQTFPVQYAPGMGNIAHSLF